MSWGTNSLALSLKNMERRFGLLALRGMAHAPQQIESLLGKAGFFYSWPDSSHILAIRTK